MELVGRANRIQRASNYNSYYVNSGWEKNGRGFTFILILLRVLCYHYVVDIIAIALMRIMISTIILITLMIAKMSNDSDSNYYNTNN